MFKEKVKKWYDRRILKREFNVGDKVLLFRSRFRFSPGKLLSRWKDHFISRKPTAPVQSRLTNFDGTKPQVVNGQRLKHNIAGDTVNVDVDLVYTTTHEENVAALFRKPAEEESGKVCTYYGKETSRNRHKSSRL